MWTDLEGKDMKGSEAPGIQKCRYCKYWIKDPEAIRVEGDCRRDPPKWSNNFVLGQWPSTRDDHWCGEFVPKLR